MFGLTMDDFVPSAYWRAQDDFGPSTKPGSRIVEPQPPQIPAGSVCVSSVPLAEGREGLNLGRHRKLDLRVCLEGVWVESVLDDPLSDDHVAVRRPARPR